MGDRRIPIVAVVGWSGVGKTTLLERLIAELRRRGYRLAAIKHTGHADLELDRPGSDSWRYAQAGAEVAVIATPRQVGLFRRFGCEPGLEEVAGMVRGVDLILVEGYKGAAVPKLVVMRGGEEPPVREWGQVLGVVSDGPVEAGEGVARFRFEEVGRIADLLEGLISRG